MFVREPERFELLSKNMDIKDPQRETIEGITEVLKTYPKPVFCNPSANAETAEAFQARNSFQTQMIQAGIPVINYISNLPKIIHQLYLHGRFLNHIGHRTA